MADVVYVIHADDGNIPSDMATGSVAEIEEHRLFYVACTRAREQLYVTHPLRYYTQPWAEGDERPLDRVTTASIRAGVRSLWEAGAEAPVPTPAHATVRGGR